MTTIGQRIKNFRKNIGLSQAELARKIGVTSQTVSKWECDVGMPDIIQIIPLADVLEVSTDAILGADTNMDKAISSALEEVGKKWADGIDNQTPDRTELHRAYDYFCAYRELFRRFPSNYKIASWGAGEGCYILTRRAHSFPEIEGFLSAQVLRDVEKMCRAIIEYDDNIEEKLAAKKRLAVALNSCGEYDRAKDELSGLPRGERDRAVYRMTTFSSFGDTSRVKAAKDGFAGSCEDFLFWLRAVADAYSAAGAPKRSETFRACENLISFCNKFTEFCNPAHLYYLKNIGYLLIAQNHIRDGNYERALDAIEDMTANCVEFFTFFTESSKTGELPESIYYDPVEGRKEDWVLESLKDHIRYLPESAVGDFRDKAGNPVVTSERYKACIRRIKDLIE